LHSQRLESSRGDHELAIPLLCRQSLYFSNKNEENWVIGKGGSNYGCISWTKDGGLGQFTLQYSTFEY
jgi:hypothetical protein